MAGVGKESGRTFFNDAARVVTDSIPLELSALEAVDAKASEPPLLQGKLEGSQEHAQPVSDTPSEIDRRSFFEVLGRAGDFSDAKAEVYALRQHLVVKNKVI